MFSKSLRQDQFTRDVPNESFSSQVYLIEFIKGSLSLQADKVEVTFEKDSIELESDYSFSGRGMELSVLVLFIKFGSPVGGFNFDY